LCLVYGLVDILYGDVSIQYLTKPILKYRLAMNGLAAKYRGAMSEWIKIEKVLFGFYNLLNTKIQKIKLIYSGHFLF